MGNESSHLSSLEVNEKAVEITDFWAHYHATVNDTGYFSNLKGSGSISVFKAESPVLGALWNSHSPLEKCSLNLMKYRHPCMLRYVWHWQQRGIHYLTTECVQPLTQVLSEQDPIQICIGLNQVAQALEFLHNNAAMSHNNVCIGSIYVLPDSTWKLGGVEMAKNFKELSANYLKQSKKYRYDKALDADEEIANDFTTVDQYAFGQLAEDVFKGRNIDDLPHWQDFKDYCQKELKNPVAGQRPNFASILKHKFFNHEFISIHEFFVSLPVKSDKEKSHFFEGLLAKLKKFNEEIVAKQLSGPLLSRLVLLDATAREKLLPFILVPKQDGDKSENGFFSQRVFTMYITPHLLKMFRVRDVQVRLLLLKYFSGYSVTFTKEDLTTHVLPELLLGIKDTNDTLVSMTLYCLAELVPVLGATNVIGGKRTKLFADGRPLTHSRIRSETIAQKTKQKRPVLLDKIEEDANENGLKNTSTVNGQHPSRLSKSVECSKSNFGSRESVELEHTLFLHERPSPDGGEDLDSELQLNVSNADEDNNWSDWETEENPNDSSILNNEESPNISSDDLDVSVLSKDVEIKPNDGKNETTVSKHTSSRLYLQKAALDAKTKKLTDISELDIKNQKPNDRNNSLKQSKDEFDFFLDMEPVIEKANVLKIEQNEEYSNLNNSISSKLNFIPVENDDKVENDAWGDTHWDD